MLCWALFATAAASRSGPFSFSRATRRSTLATAASLATSALSNLSAMSAGTPTTGIDILERFVKTDAERALVLETARQSNVIRKLMYDEIWEHAQSLK